jgi:P pilus assembly chaperone PapD
LNKIRLFFCRLREAEILLFSIFAYVLQNQFKKHMNKSLYAITLLILSLSSITAFAQVTIAPTNLFIDDNSKFGTYMVINGSNETQEISIDFFFSYANLDENGNRSLIKDDIEKAEQHSIVEYVQAFPKNFKLAPDQRQIVRLRVSAPNDLSDGTYWSRIRTSSTPESPPIELQTDQAVTAQVGIIVEQVTGLFYKIGNVNTGIEINTIRSERDGSKLTVLTDFLKTGNSPFLGSIYTSLLDQSGREVKTGFISTSIYFDGTHKQELDISDLANGTYTIKVTFETNRSDISERDIVGMEPVNQTTSFEIN